VDDKDDVVDDDDDDDDDYGVQKRSCDPLITSFDLILHFLH